MCLRRCSDENAHYHARSTLRSAPRLGMWLCPSSKRFLHTIFKPRERPALLERFYSSGRDADDRRAASRQPLKKIKDEIHLGRINHGSSNHRANTTDTLRRYLRRALAAGLFSSTELCPRRDGLRNVVRVPPHTMHCRGSHGVKELQPNKIQPWNRPYDAS